MFKLTITEEHLFNTRDELDAYVKALVASENLKKDKAHMLLTSGVATELTPKHHLPGSTTYVVMELPDVIVGVVRDS